MATLVVVCHPRPDSLVRAASARVLAGLAVAGEVTRVIDLDDQLFVAALSREEKVGYGEAPEDELVNHFDDLRWADRIVFVYPTWFSGHPARLKGWIDRVWVPGVAYDAPRPGRRIRGRLRHVRKLEIVTTHGSSRWINRLQANSGRRVIFGSLRLLCHPLCRTRLTAIYDLDRPDPAKIDAWLDDIERRFS